MFCEKCGNQIEDDAKFCPVCGNVVNASGGQETSQARPAVKVQNAADQNKKIGMIAAACIAVVVLVVLLVILRAAGVVGGRSYKKVVNQYFKAAFEGEYSTFIDTIPEEVIEYAMEEEGMTRSEVRVELVEEFEDLYETLNKYYGTSWSYECNILMYDDYGDSYFETLQEDFEDIYGIKLNRAGSVTVSMKLGVEDMETTEIFTIEVGKIGNKWYYIGAEGTTFADGSLF